LSIDNPNGFDLPYQYQESQCGEKGIQRKKSKWLFNMLKIMVGELNPAAAMPGARCTAHPRIKTAVVVNFAFPASGAHLETQQTMASKSKGL